MGRLCVKKDRQTKLYYIFTERRCRHLKIFFSNKKFDRSLRLYARFLLTKLGEHGSKSRMRNYCYITERGRGVFRFFRFSRTMLQKFGHKGSIFGLQKLSW